MNTVKEILIDVVGYEGLYMVSNYGRVWSVRSNIWLATRYNNCGYEQVDLWSNNKRVTKRVHRLVAEAWLNNYNELPEVNHKDENKSNNHLNNLEWCTSKYNTNYSLNRKRQRNNKRSNCN